MANIEEDFQKWLEEFEKNRYIEDKEAKLIYLKFKQIFRKIVNNNDVFDYNHPLDFDSVNENHEAKMTDYILTGDDVFDYYFNTEGKMYTLDISQDSNDFDLGNGYLSRIGKPGDLFYCVLSEYENFVD